MGKSNLTSDPSLCTSSEVVLGGNQPTQSPMRLSPKQEPSLSSVVPGDETDFKGLDLDLLEDTADSGTARSCSNHSGSPRWYGQSWLVPPVLPCHLLPGAEEGRILLFYPPYPARQQALVALSICNLCTHPCQGISLGCNKSCIFVQGETKLPRGCRDSHRTQRTVKPKEESLF